MLQHLMIPFKPDLTRIVVVIMILSLRCPDLSRFGLRIYL